MQDLIAEALVQNRDALFSTMSRLLAREYPDRHVLETDSGYFGYRSFAYEGQCEAQSHPDRHQEWEVDWDDYHDRAYHSIYNVWVQIKWQSYEMEVVSIGSYGSHCRDVRHYLIAPTKEVADQFFEAVCRYNAEVRGEILIFQEGHWGKSEDLFQSIQNTKLEALVLPAGQKEAVVADVEQFFSCREEYARYGIPWKRGIVLIGPPGNGKTHMIKGLVNHINRPCLYVRSFKSEYQSPYANINAVFSRARATAPCILILEDLDSLVDDETRAFFLNELDGFASNEGILTIATTNHPERLDPAIIDRPSRFDRKYGFELPGADERARYLITFGASLDENLRLCDREALEVAELTGEFSFAYLKELYLASIMAWISTGRTATILDVMIGQVEGLRAQMSSAPDEEAMADLDERMPPNMPEGLRRMYRTSMAMRRRRR